MELSQLRAPPADLPKPWKWSVWQRWLAFGFPVTVLGLWFLGRAFSIRFMALEHFGGACATSFALYLWLGLYLMGRFQMRGYSENYAAKANKPLNRAIRRYKKKKVGEGWLQLFPRYEINGRPYYLVWYVPGASSALVANLSGGAEPLLFDHSGQWLEDEDLFHKVMLMWSYALEISPRSFPFSISVVRDAKGFRRVMSKSLASLPGLLEANEQILHDRGFGPELEQVRSAYEAKCAFARNTLHILDSKVDWGEAYGWDSLTVLRYDDILAFHEAYDAVVRSRIAFVKKHKLNEAEAAALRIGLMLKPLRERLRGWKKRRALLSAIAAFSDQLPVGDLSFTREGTGWKAPPETVEAYRSRIAYAREVDAKLESQQEQAKVAGQ